MKKTIIQLAVVVLTPLVFCQCASTEGDPVREGVDKIDRAIDENLPGLGPPPEWESDPYRDS